MEGLHKLTCKCNGCWPQYSRRPWRGTRLGIRAGAGWSEYQFRIGPKNRSELTDKFNEGNGPWRVNGRARMGYADRAKAIMGVLPMISIT